jgi:hypothetical protein
VLADTFAVEWIVQSGFAITSHIRNYSDVLYDDKFRILTQVVQRYPLDIQGMDRQTNSTFSYLRTSGTSGNWDMQ